MNAEKVRALFVELVATVPPERWHERLAELADDDEDTRRRVQLLLAAHQDDSFLASPASALGVTIDEPTAERPGTVIGQYKLLEQIGEGGFGVVFMAEQQEPIRRKVALKVLKPGMDTRQVIARFEAERQALALMDHPNIAKVLEGGETASGRPYFVMDLVKGVPITDYCDQNTLTTRERLELFVSVCQAVQHAHQKGIIHRDIKPSNVLVTLHDGAPLVKVIDFGIAKALGQQLTDKTLFTGFAQMIGTPLYMSPEQAALSNVDVDTRSDIYSLGVLLYELLTGTTPFDKERLHQAGYDEMRRIIREEEPPKPSTRISSLGKAATTLSTHRKSDPKRLSQLIRGELDWIAMRALEKDRNRRYETASAFAADVQRYLHDEPVQACPPSAMYRFRKFARRNKVALAIAALLVLIVVALIAGLAVNNYLVRQEQGRTQAALSAEAERKREVRQAYETMCSLIVDDWLAKQKELLPEHRKFLEQILVNYEKFAADTGQEEESRAGVAAACLRVGNIRRLLGQRAEGEAAFRQAASLYRQLAAEFPAVAQYRAELATSHNDLGILLMELGKYSKAETVHRLAASIYEELAAEFRNVPEHREHLSRSHVNLGNVLKFLGKRSEAEAEHRKAMAIVEQLATEFPGVPRHREVLASSLNNLGLVLRELGKRSEADESHRRSVAVQEKLTSEFPSAHKYREDLALFLHNRGVALIELGRRSEAEAAWQRAVAIEAKLVKEFPSVPTHRETLGLSDHSLGLLLLEQHRVPEAEAAFRRALDIQEPLCKEFLDVPGYRDHLAQTHNSLGVLLQRLGKQSEAEAELRKSVAIREDLAKDFNKVPDYAVNLGGSCCNFGNILRRQGRCEDALGWYAKAISTLTAVLDSNARLASAREFLSYSHMGRARTLGLLNRHTEAVKDWDGAIKLNDGPGREIMRLERADTLARAKEHARATAEADAVANGKNADPDILYNAACVYALSAAAVPGDTPEGKRYAARAVELLRRAVAQGWKDFKHMKKDSDLDRVRSRDDFKKLVADLERKTGSANAAQANPPMSAGKENADKKP